MKIIPINCDFSDYDDGYDPDIEEENPFCLCNFDKTKKGLDFCECNYGCDWYRYSEIEIDCKKLDFK